MSKGTEFVQWFGPLLDALRELGGSGKPHEVSDKIAEKLNLSDEILNQTISSGESRFHNQVCWARQYLSWEGYLDTSIRGVWKLSQTGTSKELTSEEATKIFQKWNRINRNNKEQKEKSTNTPEDDEDISESSSISENYKSQVLSFLRTMSPQNFEKFCLYLLRVNGFEDLEVTGQSHDEGIDGKGILRINPVVSFNVLFQAKRYKEGNNIARNQIGDFRNAVMGRAEKGIFITTSKFTKEAEKEANREGVLKIELVDSERIIQMMEEAELGLKPITTYEVDKGFFSQYLNE